MAAARWWSKDTVAVVTGGNKGIGFEIVRGLAKQGVTTVLTARDPTRGHEASAKLAAEGLGVVFHPLDVTNSDSVGAFANWLQKEYGGLDILINNAGVLVPEVNYANAKQVLDTNFYGVKRVTEAFLPLLKSSPAGARVVTVSSRLGQLSNLRSKSLQTQLADVEHLNEQALESIAQKYLEEVKSGAWKNGGWAASYSQYSESKMFLNAYLRLLAKSLCDRPEGQKIYVNELCPGFIATDMTNHNPAGGTTEAGADTPIWLALLPAGGPSGKFFASKAEIAF